MLNRVMKEARKTSVKIEDTGKRKERKAKREPGTSSRRRTKEVAAAAAPPPEPRAAKTERRSRSRRRRRKDAGAAPAPPAVQAGEADNGQALDRKIVLTPNVQFLRDQRPGEGYPGGDGDKWHFRAEPLSGAPQIAPGAPPGHHGAGMPPHAVPYGVPPHPGMPPPGVHGPQAGAPAPMPMGRPMKSIAPKKWKVARPNTIVKATEELNSAEVRTLNEGEIVEQIAPALTLAGGIVRVLIRHPSSPQFPNPIGWVTLDATAAGGPKFLEPGPAPMSRGLPWAPPTGTKAAAELQQGPGRGPSVWAQPSATAAHAAVAAAQRPTAPVGNATWGPKGFGNLTWTPSASA